MDSNFQHWNHLFGENSNEAEAIRFNNIKYYRSIGRFGMFSFYKKERG